MHCPDSPSRENLLPEAKPFLGKPKFVTEQGGCVKTGDSGLVQNTLRGSAPLRLPARSAETLLSLHRSWTSHCFLSLLCKGGSPYYIPRGLSQLLPAETLTCEGTASYLEKYLEHSEHYVNLVKYD